MQFFYWILSKLSRFCSFWKIICKFLILPVCLLNTLLNHSCYWFYAKQYNPNVSIFIQHNPTSKVPRTTLRSLLLYEYYHQVASVSFKTRYFTEWIMCVCSAAMFEVHIILSLRNRTELFYMRAHATILRSLQLLKSELIIIMGVCWNRLPCRLVFVLLTPCSHRGDDLIRTYSLRRFLHATASFWNLDYGVEESLLWFTCGWG